MLTLTLQKTRAPKVLRSAIIMMLLLAALLNLTSVAFAQENRLLLHLEDFKDPGSLAVKLQDSRAALAKSLASQLSAKTQRLLTAYDGTSLPSPTLQKALLADLNRLIQAGSLYDEHFASIPLSERTQNLLAQNSESGEALLRLNRSLLADAYPYEIASPSEKQTPDDSKGIETCRENLRQIKLARENYRADTNEDPQWLSELSPQYLNKKVLLCPADTTAGDPGVLTEDASDPTLPCSYLYEVRPSEKVGQKFLLKMEGDMLPVVRCQHHLLNLSVSGKLYRNGPQRIIYNNSTVKIMKSVPIQTKSSADLPAEVRQRMEEERLKNSKKRTGTTVLQVNPLDNNVHAQLREQFGEAFLESPEGKALLQQLTSLPAPTNREELAHLLGKPMPDIALTNLSGKSVKLETFRGKFILLNIFSLNSDTYGSKFQRLEKLLENYDTAQLQAIGISTGDSVKVIEAFKEKYRLSMPIWTGKNDPIQTLLNRDASKSQVEVITLLLNRELVIKDVFIDFDPESLSQKVKQLIN